jgi:hypothetical protein
MHVHSMLMCVIRPAFTLDSDLCSMLCVLCSYTGVAPGIRCSIHVLHSRNPFLGEQSRRLSTWSEQKKK